MPIFFFKYLSIYLIYFAHLLRNSALNIHAISGEVNFGLMSLQLIQLDLFYFELCTKR